MSNKGYYPAHSYGFGRVYMEFSFQANATSNPTLVYQGQSGTQTVFGVGANDITSITYGATGIFTVTLAEKFWKVVYMNANIDYLSTDNPGAFATCGEVTGEGQNTTPAAAIVFKIRCYEAGGTAFAPAAAHVIRCQLAFRNSSATNPA